MPRIIIGIYIRYVHAIYTPKRASTYIGLFIYILLLHILYYHYYLLDNNIRYIVICIFLNTHTFIFVGMCVQSNTRIVRFNVYCDTHTHTHIYIYIYSKAILIIICRL